MDEPQRYSGRRRRRPTSPRPRGSDAARFVWGLIAVNVLVFVLWHVSGRAGVRFMAANFMVSLDSVTDGRVWTLLTSAVSHVDAGHLLFNMLALYVFGRPVTEALGTRSLLHLYVAGGLVASVGHVLFGLIGGNPRPALGASGAVMAIAVVFAALFPRATLLVNFLVPLRAPIAVALYVAIDLFGLIGGLGGSAGGGVAHAAHLGGALYGLVFYLVRSRGSRRNRRK